MSTTAGNNISVERASPEQEVAGPFVPVQPFRVHRWLSNGHLQTVMGAYIPHKKIVHPTTDQLVELPDGDKLVLQEQLPPKWLPGDPVALLVHGLGGAAQSHYMVRKADRLCAAGARVFRLNLRGCGPGMPHAKGICHAGRSEDAGAGLEYLIDRFPESPVSLIGFSMGGNIVLKLAGELGENVPPGLVRVISVAPPIDLARCCRNIQLGMNRVYDRSFVRGLNRIVMRRQTEVPDAEHIIPGKWPKSLYEFDELITAPLSGFAGADEYYQRSSALPLVGGIRVPTMIITADDDPVIPVAMFDDLPASPFLRTHITRGGGHLGFLSAKSADPDRRWLDWRLIEQVMSPVT